MMPGDLWRERQTAIERLRRAHRPARQWRPARRLWLRRTGFCTCGEPTGGECCWILRSGLQTYGARP